MFWHDADHHEILLFQSQFLSFRNVVSRVENLCDHLCTVGVSCRISEVSIVEGVHVEGSRVSGRPQSKLVYSSSF